MVRAPRHPALQGLVEVVWHVGPAAARGAQEWSLPDGKVHLAFRPCGAPIRVRGERFAGWVVGGPGVQPYLRDTPPQARSMGVVLAPGVAPLLLGVPAAVLHERHVSLADLWAAHDLEALADGPDPLDRLEAALAMRLAGRRPDRRTRRLAQALASGVSLEAAADELGLGPRRARDLAWAAFGLSPRDVRRVARLQQVFEDWRRLPGGWAERALRCGYVDQGHLVREFKALTGFTPARWRPRPGEPHHVPLPDRPSADPASG